MAENTTIRAQHHNDSRETHTNTTIVAENTSITAKNHAKSREHHNGRRTPR